MTTPKGAQGAGSALKLSRRRWAWAGTGAVVAVGVLGTALCLSAARAARAVETELRVVQHDAGLGRYRAAFARLPALSARLRTLRTRLGPFRALGWVPGLGPAVVAVARDDQAALDVADAVMPLRPELAGFLRDRGAVGPLLQILRLPLRPSALRLQDAARLARFPPPAWPKGLGGLYRARGTLDRLAALVTLMARDAGPLRAALGDPRPARYLVMFQDGGELRATGGFLSAWAILTVREGRLSPVEVEDITGVSRAAHYAAPAPFPLRWAFHDQTASLMDSNFSPNVPTSVRRLERYLRTVPGMPRLTGVILVDTWMLERLLDVLGPVTVPVAPGVERTVTASNTESTLVYVAEKLRAPLGGRKQFLTPLADTLLARAEEVRRGRRGPRDRVVWNRVLGVLLAGLAKEHLVLYANNAGVEALLERAGWAGSMPAPRRRNFLEVVNANYGGLKDNAFMTERVAVQVGPVLRGRVVETVTVGLVLPVPADGWLTGAYNGFISAYFPRGTKVLRTSGRPMRPLETAGPSADPPLMTAGATIHFPAAADGRPASGSVTFRVLLPKGLPVFPLTVGKQPGVPKIALSVSGLGLGVHTEQSAALRILLGARGLSAVPLRFARPPL